MNVYKLKTPLSEKDIRDLKAGDLVYLTGKNVYVVSFAVAANYLLDHVKKGRPLFDLDGSVV